MALKDSQGDASNSYLVINLTSKYININLVHCFHSESIYMIHIQISIFRGFNLGLGMVEFKHKVKESKWYSVRKLSNCLDVMDILEIEPRRSEI